MSILRASAAAEHGPLATPPAEVAAAPRGRALPGLGVPAGVTAMVCVGGSVAVSSVLAGAPFFTAEAVRYAGACLLLVLLARATGRRLVLPRGADWLWLGGIALTGLVMFNVALVQGSGHAEPAVLGVAVACVPAVLAVIGPLLEGSRPRRSLIAAALVVTCGAALVQGAGRTDAIGVAWAVAVFACEAAFTLLAIPVLGRHGPWGVSVHATWLAAVIFGVIGVVHEGPAAAAHLTRADWLAVTYLTVAVTAVAFVLWYSCVSRLGASQAGLLTGVAPVAAAGTGVLLGGAAPRPLVWAGIAVVGAGLGLGFRPGRRQVAAGGRPGKRTADAVPLRLRGDEDYLRFGEGTEHPAAGEVIFADRAGQAHARRWTSRQSGQSAVRGTTASVLIVAEALHQSAAADVTDLTDAVTGLPRVIGGR